MGYNERADGYKMRERSKFYAILKFVLMLIAAIRMLIDSKPNKEKKQSIRQRSFGIHNMYTFKINLSSSIYSIMNKITRRVHGVLFFDNNKVEERKQ